MPTKKRSPCPIACTLDILGDKWTLLVIRDLMLGRSHFKEFSQSPEGIATNILTDRLSRLLEAGVIERFPSTEHLGRNAYRLTPRGKALRPVISAITKWGLTHIDGTAARMQAKRGVN